MISDTPGRLLHICFLLIFGFAWILPGNLQAYSHLEAKSDKNTNLRLYDKKKRFFGKTKPSHDYPGFAHNDKRFKPRLKLDYSDLSKEEAGDADDLIYRRRRDFGSGGTSDESKKGLHEPRSDYKSGEPSGRKVLYAGGRCSGDSDCYSGFCVLTHQPPECAMDSMVRGKVAGGGRCSNHKHCYSGYCNRQTVPFTCAPDSKLMGKVAGGGACSTNANCYSGFCDQQAEARTCAKDGCEVGKVAGGGRCEKDNHCYSGVCGWSSRPKRCSKDAPVPNKVGSGGECFTDDQCYSGRCVKGDIGRECT